MKLHFFGSFKLFPGSKIDFWPFLKLQKMEFGQKNFVKLIYEFFGVDFFLIFWPIVYLFLAKHTVALFDSL